MPIRAREISTGRLARLKPLATDPSAILIFFEGDQVPWDIERYRIDPNKPRFILLEETE